jgi:glycosyltransferase involved in cell wall biosynthesis
MHGHSENVDQAFERDGRLALGASQAVQTPMPDVICVLGMHRSGTSVVARLINLLGVYLGPSERLVPPDADNPRGYWEHLAFHDVNEQILARFGGSWHEPPVFPPGWPNSPDVAPHAQQARAAIAEDFADAVRWGWKDPRTCLTLPFWQTLGLPLRYVVCVRNVSEVVRSLQGRDGFSADKGAALWLTYTASMLTHTAGRPRLFVWYGDLVEDPEREARRIAKFLGVPAALDGVEGCAAVQGIVDEVLQHHRGSLVETAEDDEVLFPAKAVYVVLRAVVYAEGSKAPGPEGETLQAVAALARSAVDAVPIDWSAGSPLTAIQASRRSLRGASARFAALGEQVTDLAEQVETLTDRVQSLRALHVRQWHQLMSEVVSRVEQLLGTRTWRVGHALVGRWDRLRRRGSSSLPEEVRTAVAGLQALADSSPVRLQAWLEAQAHALGVLRHQVDRLGASRDLRLGRMLARVGNLVRRHARVPGAIEQTPVLIAQAQRHLLAFHQALCEEQTGWAQHQSDRLAEARGSRTGGTETAEGARPFVARARAPVGSSEIKLIAFYLPQFHPVQENNEWWGEGFTEWTNVTKARPMFVGHYQPRLPGDLGFYDLRVPEIQQRQIELARQYGIHGFAFHYYWFAGKRILERPLEQLLANPRLDFPFCFCWANENWTRRWDGGEHEVLIAQQHSPADDLAMMADVTRAFRDPRYIRFDGRPLLIVYRPQLLPDARATVHRWRDYCQRAGVGDPFLVAAQTFGNENPTPLGFDAAVGFPPHNFRGAELTAEHRLLNPLFAGRIYDYGSLVEASRDMSPPPYTLFRGVCPSWDNSPRSPLRAQVFVGSTPELYEKWLENACTFALANHPSDERLVFVNAWNEWAESAYLEPDRRYGYAYLEATARVLRRYPKLPAGRVAGRNPLVSIVVPAYNHCRFVVAALDSARRQTYAQIEIVVIDDGSTDGTARVVAQYVEAHPDVRWTFVEQPNRGAPAAINEAVRRASGDYIAILASDDGFHPKRVETLLGALQSSGALLAFSNVHFVDEAGAALDERHPRVGELARRIEEIAAHPSIELALMDSNVVISTGNLMFARQLADKLGGFQNYRDCHDWDFILRALAYTSPVYVARKLYTYRLHGANIFQARAAATAEVDRILDGFLSEGAPTVFARLGADGAYQERLLREQGYRLRAGQRVT